MELIRISDELLVFLSVCGFLLFIAFIALMRLLLCWWFKIDDLLKNQAINNALLREISQKILPDPPEEKNT